MAETGMTSLGERINLFERHVMTRQSRLALTRQRLAREVLIKMAEGEPYGIREFIYAASLGQPDKYEDQARMLEATQGLGGGKVIGVVNEDQLGVVGVTARNDPLSMFVSTGETNPDPSKAMCCRTLRADVVLGARRFNTGSQQYEFMVEQDSNGLTLVNLLVNSGREPMLHESTAFYKPKQLIYGARAVLDFVVHQNDQTGLEAVADLLNDTAAGHSF